ncbi:MAG: right-handed parallel beta-helix repeat-containing protein, partial [Thermoflexales bacterium]|nr:right-handed parallel beta-helix repeat-containing protein [Thermoflexales bacterium]
SGLRRALWLALALICLPILATPDVALAAGITVTTLEDVVADDGLCSLREAVENANTDGQQFASPGECAAGSGADTVTLPSGRLALADGGNLTLEQSIALVGAGQDATAIVGWPGYTVIYAYVGGGGLRPAAVLASRQYVFRDLTISGGYNGIDLTDYDGDVLLERVRVSDATGYGIQLNAASVVISQSVITRNTYRGIYVGNGPTQIVRSRIIDNLQDGAYIYPRLAMSQTLVAGNGSTGLETGYEGATIVNSVFSANGGDGLNLRSNVAFTNSTIVANGGRGIYDEDYVPALANTIVFMNGAGNCDVNGSIVSRGHNIAGDATCAGLTGAGDLTNTNPLLGPFTTLAPNGMPGFSLLPGSPALDVASDCPPEDIRGAARPFGVACDIGAFERTADNGSLSGIVYSDNDNNGARAVTETGVAGVAIRLTGAGLTLTTQTDLSGSFAFGGLPAGTYALSETQPSATHDDGQDALGSAAGTLGNDLMTGIALTSAQNATDYLFGERALPVIAGRLFFDQNNDGLFDSNVEYGISAEQILITGTNDLGQGVWLTLTTSSIPPYGEFDSGPIRPGAYAIGQIQPAGWLDGKDTPGTNAATAGNDQFTTVLTLGQASRNNLFGELGPAQIGGRVFIDLDGDGQPYFYEPGIGGVTLTLAGVDDLGAAVLMTTATEPGGSYVFANLRPGAYILTETQPISYADGGDDTSGALLANDVFTYSLAPAASESGSFGERARGIVGSVLNDPNNNGIFDSGESRMPNVPITLTDSAGVTRTQETGPYGFFIFEALPAGTYTLTAAQPTYYDYDAGGVVPYLDGREAVGNGGGITATNDVISGIVYTADAVLEGYVFAELSRSTLRGFVWLDANANDIYDYAEAYLNGVTLILSGTPFR